MHTAFSLAALLVSTVIVVLLALPVLNLGAAIVA